MILDITLRNPSLLLILLFYFCILCVAPPTQASSRYATDPAPCCDHLQFPDLSYGAEEYPRPEHYIDPVLEYGLNMVLPKPVREGLLLDAGYDRWQGLPTFKLDYFLPVKAWSEKSLFVAPRVCLTGVRESFSLGMGIRKLIGSEAMVGLHAFHDWVRPRGTRDPFLREAGLGLEFSVLPGNFSDFTLSINAYVPVNERRSIARDGTATVKESLPYGLDARLAFLLPAISDSFDVRLDGQAHTYRADKTNVFGYTAGVTLSSRSGVLSATAEKGYDDATGDDFRILGNVTMAFDWVELVNGKSPFSAPYTVTPTRYNRKMRDSLYTRVIRQHDLPTDRSERRVTLASAVMDDTVTFRGAFPTLPNSMVTVQVSQSPWEDVKDVRTDSEGTYSGTITLPPGTYRLRLIHRPTGLVTGVTTLVISDSQTSGN